MNKQDLLEFAYYLEHRIRAWLSQHDDNRTYVFAKNIANKTWIFLCRVYYENLYLAMKGSLLKQSYPIIGHPQIKWIILSVIYMILMLHFHVLIFAGLILLVILLILHHQRYMKDVSCMAVRLIADQLSFKSAKDFYYMYPFQEFRVLFTMYQLLEVDQQNVGFDDFIAEGSLQGINEKGLGRLITFKINARYFRQSVGDTDDYTLTSLMLLPDEDTRQYIKNGWIKQDLIGLIDRTPTDIIVQKMVENKIYNCYPLVKMQIERLEVQEAQAQQNIQQQLYIEEHHLPDKIQQIWEYFDRHGEDLGFSYWDNNGNSVTGNEGYISMRMRLIGATTYNDAKKKVSLVEKQLRCDVMTKPVTSDHGSFQMTFVLGQITAPKMTNVQTIKTNASAGKLVLGNSRTGEYRVRLPRDDDLTSILCGALSRSGKSTMMTQVILSLLYLRTSAGYDYQDVFIATVKDEDYIVNGFKQSGMLVKSDPAEIYNMLQYVDDQATKRKALFIERGVKNIKEFNHQFPSEYLGKMLIVFDEYANTLAVAESERIEVGGKKVKLRDAIERIMVKIGQEHGSRGVSIIVITQQFAKGEVGRLFDVTNIQILGYARSNVWNSIDNTQEMSKYLESKSEQRRGLFFVNAPDLPTDKPQIAFNSGFTEVHTANIDTQEVRRDFDRKFETAKNYGEPVESVQDKSIRTDLEAPVDFGNLIKTSNNND